MDSPFYIHPSDNPGMVLSTKIFDGSGFYAWRSSMIIALKAKNKFGFLSGDVHRPPPDSPDFSRWERCNAMISSWLLNAMTKDIAESFLLSGDAQQIWSDLEARFSQSNGAHLFSIEKELSTISQASDSISGYFTRIKRLWDEKDSLRNFPPCSCGLAEAFHKMNNDQRLLQFLMGLIDSYSVVRGSILMMDPLPSVHQAYSLLVQEEKQRGLSSTSKLLTDSSSLNVHSAPKGSSEANVVNSAPQKGKRTYYCTHCKKNNHSIERCYKIIGYPPRSNQSNAKSNAHTAPEVDTTSQDSVSLVPGLTTEQYSQLLSLLQQSSATSNSMAHMAGTISQEEFGSWSGV